MGIVGEPRNRRRVGPRLSLPPTTPRAGFSARHPSKDAAQPQLRNFREFALSAARGPLRAIGGSGHRPFSTAQTPLPVNPATQHRFRRPTEHPGQHPALITPRPPRGRLLRWHKGLHKLPLLVSEANGRRHRSGRPPRKRARPLCQIGEPFLWGRVLLCGAAGLIATLGDRLVSPPPQRPP